MSGPLASLSTDRTYISRVEGHNVASGTEYTLFNQTGPGYVRNLWMAVGGGNNPALDARIRVYYDGSATPAIDIDLGTLFATHWGANGNLFETDHTHVEIQSSNDSLSFLFEFPMPFGTSIRIAYYYPTGYSQTAGIFSMVTYALTATDEANGQRLRCQGARFADQHITRAAGDVNTLATITGGPGSVVYASYVAGCLPGATAFTWLERNWAFYVDGEATPSVETTGTEDTFDSGWYFNGAKNYNAGRHSYVGTNAPSAQPYALGMVTDLWGKWGGVAFTDSLTLKVLTEGAVTTGDTFCYSVLYYQ